MDDDEPVLEVLEVLGGISSSLDEWRTEFDNEDIGKRLTAIESSLYKLEQIPVLLQDMLYELRSIKERTR